jgi:hypothetical protein
VGADCRVTVPPTQTAPLTEALMEGQVTTFTVVVAVPVQPLLSVTVTL